MLELFLFLLFALYVSGVYTAYLSLRWLKFNGYDVSYWKVFYSWFLLL